MEHIVVCGASLAGLRAVETLLAQRDLLPVRLAREVVLGERRPVVGLVRLRPDERQPTLETVPPQGLDRTKSGQRRTDDDDSIHDVQGPVSPRS